MGDRKGIRNSTLKLISSLIYYCAANLPHFCPRTSTLAAWTILPDLRSSVSLASMNNSSFQCVLGTRMPIMCPSNHGTHLLAMEHDKRHPIQPLTHTHPPPLLSTTSVMKLSWRGAQSSPHPKDWLFRGLNFVEKNRLADNLHRFLSRQRLTIVT